MRMLKGIAFVGLLVCALWFVLEPGFEPAAGAIAALLTLGGLFVRSVKANGARTVSQNQSISGGSTGMQAGGDIHIGRKGEGREQ